MASSDCIVDVEILEARLRTREPGRTPAKLAILDIGTFPTSPPASTQEIPERAAAENFHFLKWIHRSNNSDLALVTLQNDSNLKILKIHKREHTFLAEKAAYARLQTCGVQSTGAVLKCYGWSVVKPKSFFSCDIPTCSGNEEGEQRVMRRGERDPFLPSRTGSPNKKATYSWDNPSEKRMMDFGVDFRPPSVEESWFWVMDNSQFGSDGQWLPSGHGLSYQRHALLLEYLPRARRMDSHIITKKLALQALAGAQRIQKALVVHGDQSKQNLLVTQDDRAVWVDFDRSVVLDKANERMLFNFKRDLIHVHEMLFSSFYELPVVPASKW